MFILELDLPEKVAILAMCWYPVPYRWLRVRDHHKPHFRVFSEVASAIQNELAPSSGGVRSSYLEVINMSGTTFFLIFFGKFPRILVCELNSIGLHQKGDDAKVRSGVKKWKFQNSNLDLGEIFIFFAIFLGPLCGIYETTNISNIRGSGTYIIGWTGVLYQTCSKNIFKSRRIDLRFLFWFFLWSNVWYVYF